MDNKVKHLLRIILFFPAKFILFLICTIFFPFIWLIDEELTLKVFFSDWKDFLLDKF